jgi:hypothetical protein
MIVRIAAAIILLGGFTGLVLFMANTENADPAATEPGGARSETLILSSASDCAGCHPAVYAEWKESWHARAWFDPLVRAPDQSDNFKKKDCIPCHAPRPIFEAGIRPGERVIERQANRQDGVDCLACHRLPEGGFAAGSRDAQGPCGPTFHRGMITTALCTPCHNQHNTVDEWNASPENLRGENCNHCHYPPVKRPGRKDGPEREGRSHRLCSWRNENLDMTPLTYRTHLVGAGEDRKIRVRLINDRTPHNVPADSRNRALDLVLTFIDAGGQPFPAADGKRKYGREPGTYRLRFRNPYRSEIGQKNTQIVAGTEAVLEAPVPAGAIRAKIKVLYKLTPFSPDDEAITIRSEEIDLREEDG